MNRILTGVLKESLGKAPPFLVQRSMNSQRGKKYSVLPAFHSSQTFYSGNLLALVKHINKDLHFKFRPYILIVVCLLGSVQVPILALSLAIPRKLSSKQAYFTQHAPFQVITILVKVSVGGHLQLSVKQPHMAYLRDTQHDKHIHNMMLPPQYLKIQKINNICIHSTLLACMTN